MAGGGCQARKGLGSQPHIRFLAWFNSRIFAGDKSGVAGVELAIASEPPARQPRIWGRRPRASTPATPEL